MPTLPNSPKRSVPMSNQHSLESSYVEVVGHQIAYLDIGEGSQTLLMVHGNPVSSHVYAPLIDELSGRYRCIAPDLLGFGQSDKPHKESAYTLPRHIRIVAEFVRALDLQGVVLVVHDWGGPIGLGAALVDQSRYSHLVILNTLTEAPMKIPLRYWLPFHALMRMPRLADYLVKHLNLFQKVAVSDMDESDRAVYFRANDSPSSRAGIAAFPHMIPHNRHHPNYPLLRDLLANLEAWNLTALIMFSDQDSVFSAEQGKQLAKRMQDATFELIDGAGHYLQYEQPSEVAFNISAFLGEGG